MYLYPGQMANTDPKPCPTCGIQDPEKHRRSSCPNLNKRPYVPPGN